MSSTIAIDFILPWTQATATSLQTVFDATWTADDADDVIVYARGTGVATDDATQLISSADYTVTFVGTDEDVRVTFSVGRTLDDIVTLTRKTPTSRLNLYSNTNFTPSMLNGDFNKLVMMLQERVLENLILPDSASASTRLSPKYNNSESLTYPNDTILPILTAGGIWRKNDGNTAFAQATIPTYPVGSDADFTNDNRMVKTDTSGTYNNIQQSGISIDDSDVLTGVGGMTVAGLTYPTSDGTANQVIGTDGANTLTFQSVGGTVDSVSGTANEIDVSGTADNPVVGLSSTLVAPGTVTLNADPTLALQAATKQYVDGTVSSTFDGFFNSLILEHTTMTASSDGASWTATITGPGTSDLTISWSTGLETFDATPAASVGLTTGTDAVPVLNYVYVPIGTKTLTASTAGWPAAEEFAAVMTVLCQSVATGQTDEPYKVHGWHDDVTEAATDKGHSSSLNQWIRSQAATWISGTALTPTVGVATFDVAVAAGVVLQLHQNDFPALDTGGAAHVNVVNDSVTAYDKVTDLSTLLTDANGVSMSNKRFNMVIWGCMSEDASQCKLFLNLPTASYNNNQGAIDDSDRTAVFTVPVAFRGTGFLISRLSVRHVSSSNTWSILQNEDLRGLSPAVATGSGVGGITAVSDDPTPTLGGNLDGGAFDLTNLANATITTNVINSALTANTALTAGASKELVSSATTDTELGYVSGVTSAIQTQINAIDAVNIKDTQDFRLTLTTATPVTTADVTAATTIYCTPYNGNAIALYDGSSAWDTITSAEFSIAVPATTDTMYDVFAYNNSGTATLELTAWTDDTNRATALVYQDGVLCKTGVLTRRYVGSVRTTGSSGEVDDSVANRYLWNYYNRVVKPMSAKEATDTWTYTTATWRQANASTANQLDFIIGVNEDIIEAQLNAEVGNGSQVTVAASIGLDSTSAPSALCIYGHPSTKSSGTDSFHAAFKGFVGIGRHYLAWLEASQAVGTSTWTGDAAAATLAAGNGLMGRILC